MPNQHSALRRAVTSPLARGIGVCAFTLIPGRAFPRWMQHTLTWGSAAAVGAVVAIPGASEKILRRETSEEGATRERMHPAARATLASAAAVIMAGTWVFSWWADERTERALRKLRLPHPRLWIGVGLGAVELWTETQRRSQSALTHRGRQPDHHKALESSA